MPVMGEGPAGSYLGRALVDWKWKRDVLPSTHMPRWASRLTLEVVSVRVERAQGISASDIESEGLQCHSVAGRVKLWTNQDNQFCDEHKAFAESWDSIHANPNPVYHRGESGQRYISHYTSYPWEDVQEQRSRRGRPWYVYGNPWAWVLSFKELAHEEAH